MRRAEVICGDALETLRGMADNSCDACITDPPSATGFMNMAWDKNKGGREQWVAWLASIMREVARVLKPGAHAFVWAFPRTSHWTGWALEDAGFAIRHRHGHLFATSMPKSMNLGEGRGTALRPSMEDWYLVRKPPEGTLKANLAKWGTGALYIDRCRLPGPVPSVPQPAFNSPTGLTYGMKTGIGRNGEMSSAPGGRWPPDVSFEHGPSCDENGCEPGCPVRELEEQSGEGVSVPRIGGEGEAMDVYAAGWGFKRQAGGYSDRGTAARFFPVFDYVPKPCRSERERGCHLLPKKSGAEMVGRNEDSVGIKNGRAGSGRLSGAHNHHPTPKALTLMRNFARLITPPDGLIIDPFSGSASIGVAALEEGFSYIGIEREPDYCEIGRARLAAAMPHQPNLRGLNTGS